MERKKTPDLKTDNQTVIISAPVVTQSFVNRKGKKTDRTDMYIQRSIQDYFIKFCESKVSREELEKHMAEKTGLIKAATLEVEFREGAWDICDEEEEVQSRMGEYVIVHRIVSKKTD